MVCIQTKHFYYIPMIGLPAMNFALVAGLVYNFVGLLHKQYAWLF